MSEPHYADDRVTVWAGDCLEVLPTLPDSSVDCVVTDPPYGLEFMGKDWDRFRPAEYVGGRWDGRGLAITSGDAAKAGADDMADRLQAFPSLTYKANQKCRACGKWQRDKPHRKCVCIPPDFEPRRNDRNAGFQAWCELWAAECLRILKPGGMLLAFGGTRTSHRLACAIEDAGFEIRDSIAWLYGSGFSKAGLLGNRPDISWCQCGENPIPHESLDDGARRGRVGCPRCGGTPNEFRGFSTTLKPAHEPIIVARKPLTGTVAANVLRHGTGALNIDATRIGTSKNVPASTSTNPKGAGGWGFQRQSGEESGHDPDVGRWPANVVLDESQAAALDQMSGELTSGAWNGVTNAARPNQPSKGAEAERVRQDRQADSGGASRFFYTAKASTDERITHREPMCVCGHSRSQHDNDEWGSCLVPGCWCPGFAIDRSTVKTTSHPTVKPLDLMRWLVRLVCPPGGVILEPFAGSGTTVEAALLEGFRCIAIEREPDYLPMIVQRIHRRRDPIAYITAAGEDLGLFGLDDEPEAPAQPQGRWPANVVLDRSQAEALDEMSEGTRAAKPRGSGGSAGPPGYVYNSPRGSEPVDHGGEGNASRFFKVVDGDVGLGAI